MLTAASSLYRAGDGVGTRAMPAEPRHPPFQDPAPFPRARGGMNTAGASLAPGVQALSPLSRMQGLSGKGHLWGAEVAKAGITRGRHKAPSMSARVAVDSSEGNSHMLVGA